MQIQYQLAFELEFHICPIGGTQTKFPKLGAHSKVLTLNKFYLYPQFSSHIRVGLSTKSSIFIPYQSWAINEVTVAMHSLISGYRKQNESQMVRLLLGVQIPYVATRRFNSTSAICDNLRGAILCTHHFQTTIRQSTCKHKYKTKIPKLMNCKRSFHYHS